MTSAAAISDDVLRDATLIWNYHQMHHSLRHCSAAIALGSHDLGVATFTTDLFRRGLFPLVVFTGANSPTTRGKFPRGEAVHYREHAMGLGVPDAAIMVEPHATNTGQNIVLSRDALARAGVDVESVLIVSKPYMERRAYATCRKEWPRVATVCASEPQSMQDYIDHIGDARLVVDMLVGDLQRVIEYPQLGYAIAQDVPADVMRAYDCLLDRGFDSRLLAPKDR